MNIDYFIFVYSISTLLMYPYSHITLLSSTLTEHLCSPLLFRQQILSMVLNMFPQLINMQNSCGDTPIHLAASARNKGMIRILLVCTAHS